MKYKIKDEDADLFMYLNHIQYINSESNYWKKKYNSIFDKQYHCYCCHNSITRNDSIPYNRCDSCQCKYHVNCYKINVNYYKCPQCKKIGRIYTSYN